ncbi:MAG: iron ABC transporter ATP-binding protein [Euryarchaeota archaeon]|nr:iron ABC transporter ATP-binding protein [Euryarchaeota archaeon]
MSSLLEVSKLNYSWGQKKVLNDITFDIQSNHIVAILGKNGVGKTTLIKCINRVLNPDSGTIKISTQNTSDLSFLDISKSVSYVPQSVKTSFSMDVFEVVLLGRKPHISWRVSKEDREAVSRTLRLLGLEDLAFRKFDRLSGGERQRVVVAKAVVQDPSIFLFDEPTSDLDLRNQIEVMKSIKQIVSDSESEKSAIIAIHDINIAARFADRILLLHNGKIKADGTPTEVLTRENIAQVFEVTCEIILPTEKSPMRVLVDDEIWYKEKKRD